MMRPALITATGLLAASLLAGCATTTAPSAPGSASPVAASTSTGLPVGQAPDGSHIPSGKPTWLVDLPDPGQVDRSNPEAVMRAYVITAFTWDTTTDKTSAYAAQRAAIYLDAAQQAAADAYDPDIAKGQESFTTAAAHDCYTTVTIRSITAEGLDTGQDGSSVRRIVHYLVRTLPRDGSAAPDTQAWDAWVTATPQRNQWTIATMQTQTSQN